jgi:hypothetical protein
MPDRRLEPIHITVPTGPQDPREPSPPDPPGVIVHRVPALHPDDMDVVAGIPVTSVSRTLIDCAEDATADELREMMLRAIELGIFDLDARYASLGRVEWRPSLALVHEVLEEVLREAAA